MKPITSLLVALLLLAGASATAAPLAPGAAVIPAMPDLALDVVSPLTTTEMATLTGSAPSWVQAGCAAVGGFTGARAGVKQIAKQLGKRVVIGTVCPVCGTVVTVAAIGCLFL